MRCRRCSTCMESHQAIIKISSRRRSLTTQPWDSKSTVAQIIEGFVPGGSLLGALVQYAVNKDLLDWKKQQTQKQGRGTYYIDQQVVQNKEQLLEAGVQSIFDLATSIIGPPDGLVADV